MSQESRPSAVGARYQSESAGYLRLSFSRALRSAISVPHACDHSVQARPPVGEEGGGDICCTVLWSVTVVAPHLVSQLQLSRRVWCCGHCCCAAFGVVVAIIVPCVVSCALSSCHICVAVSVIVLCVVLWALSSCHIRCCGCCHCTTHGVMVVVGVIEPCGVAVTFVAWSQWVLSHSCCAAWCRGYGCCAMWCH
jgi:hypothetical protein